MKQTSKGIKINNNLWFRIIRNKLVFGNSEKSKEIHSTISFGNKSGIFDLHLTNQKNNKHFTVVTISHKEVLRILPELLNKIKNSVFELEILKPELFKENKIKFYRILEFKNILEEIVTLKKKKKIDINQESEEFKLFVNKLMKSYETEEINYSEICNSKEFTGFIKLKSEIVFIIKSQYLDNEIYIVKNLDLNIDSVLRKVLGNQVFDQIIERINLGILEIEK